MKPHERNKQENAKPKKPKRGGKKLTEDNKKEETED
jgi:hypothetical protein